MHVTLLDRPGVGPGCLNFQPGPPSADASGPPGHTSGLGSKTSERSKVIVPELTVGKSARFPWRDLCGACSHPQSSPPPHAPRPGCQSLSAELAAAVTVLFPLTPLGAAEASSAPGGRCGGSTQGEEKSFLRKPRPRRVRAKSEGKRFSRKVGTGFSWWCFFPGGV